MAHYCFLAEYSASRFLEGTNHIVFEISKELVRRGDSVTILSPFWNEVSEKEKEPWAKNGIEVRFFRAPFIHNPVSRTLFYFLNGFFLALSKKTDVFFGAYTLPPTLATIWLGMVFRKKRFIGIWEEGACQKINAWPFFKPFYSHASAVQTLSASIKQMFVQNFWVKPEKVRVIYGFADLNLFKPVLPKDKGLMKKYGFSAKDFVFLFVGRVSELKGAPYLIKAMADVKGAKLLMVGRIIEQDYYEKLVRELGLENRVFFGNYVPRENLPQYFNLCDCFVLPSLSEGFGIVFAEAFACAKPVIATDHGPLPEVVGNSGLIVPTKDSKTLAAAMNTMKRDKAARQAFAKNALLRSKEFEKEKIIKKFADMLHE